VLRYVPLGLDIVPLEIAAYDGGHRRDANTRPTGSNDDGSDDGGWAGCSDNDRGVITSFALTFASVAFGLGSGRGSLPIGVS
jgi:hypothetical protein